MTRNKKQYALLLGALGVVFGDIGTNPLYALKILMGLTDDSNLDKTVLVYGLTSLLLWTIVLVLCVKYILFVMRVSNKGEGGVMALVALITGVKGTSSTKADKATDKTGPKVKIPRKPVYIAIGLIGVALFYGDSVVTPAISVLSAVEGIDVVAPYLSPVVVPLTLIMLILLFGLQRYGTGVIGKLFGPVMLVWFLALGLGGLWRVWQYPDVLQALSPVAALSFVVAHPGMAFIAMGAIVLAVAGAEALYADMGHFGRAPIAKTWLLLVFPALALCYMGQSAIILHMPGADTSPFFLLYPPELRVPMIVLATAATLIASQAVISGAFSLTRQAIQLGYLPRMQVKQTSEKILGQIYLPFVNALLFVFVAALVVFFGTSENLAGAYGMAVSGTLATDSLLFIAVAYYFWHRSKTFIVSFAAVFLTLDLILIAANIPKILHGGWLPLLIATSVLIVMYTWRAGQQISAGARKRMEQPLQEFVVDFQKRVQKRAAVHTGPGLGSESQPRSLVRLPGQAVYIGYHVGLTPTALRVAVNELHELHEKAVIVYVKTSTAAHVPPEERAEFDELGYADGISQVVITYGFHDTPNIPKTLETIRHLSPELEFDPQEAVYFVSLSRIVESKRHTAPAMRGWQKNLYAFMSNNALSSTDYYRLPVENTIEMRTLIKV